MAAALLQALAAGALAAQALPPRHWWWLLPVAFGWLLWLFEAPPLALGRGARARRTAALLYAFGLGWFGFSLSWVGEAFLVDAERFAALRPLAIVALPAVLALFFAAAGAVVGLVCRETICRASLLAVALPAADALRARPFFFGGFPWNFFAWTLDPEHLLALMQSASLIGVSGLSALVVFWALLPGLLALSWRRGPRARLRAGGAALLGLALLAGLWVWGERRLATPPIAPPPMRLVIVQPDIAQKDKWRPENRRRIFNLLLRLSRAGIARARTLAPDKAPIVVVWPESAVPFLLDASPAALKKIADILPSDGWLFTGALRRAGGTTGRLYNAILGIDGEGRVRFIYDKRHLVPFGEYLPLRRWLEPLGVRKLVPLPAGFLPGTEGGPFALPGLAPFEASICYEIAFSDTPKAAAAEYTRWLLNVTNDGWYGESAGPWQHLMAARYHAIVRGLLLVRAANTGVSAVFDGRGRILGSLSLNRRGVLALSLANHFYAISTILDRQRIVLACASRQC